MKSKAVIGMAQKCIWLEFPNAVCLSTVDSAGKPDARTVLVKSVSTDGLTFFTNYNSPKGQQLAFNNSACMTFFWDALQHLGQNLCSMAIFAVF